MLRVFLNYLLGYVIITIKGAGVERFLNLAVQRGINIWDVSWINKDTVQAKVQLLGIKPLRHVARVSRCRFRINNRCGMPFLVMYLKRRKMLVFGGVFFAVSLYILSSFVLFIEITSPEPLKLVNPEKIKVLAAEQGIVVGRPKWVMDFALVEKYIVIKEPQLSWVGIRTKGTKVEIEVVEKVLPDPGESDRKSGNIVATKDGIISEILVMKGQPRVKPGDTVSRGQVLISCTIVPEQTNAEDDKSPQKVTQVVKAEGIVKARVWYRGYGECPIIEKGTKNTGKETKKVSLRWKDNNIIVWGPKKSPFNLNVSDEKVNQIQIWRNIKLPVEIITTTYREQSAYQTKWGEAGAWQQAVKLALNAAKRQIPSYAKITNQKVKAVEENIPGLKRAYVILETEEQIGELVPIE